MNKASKTLLIKRLRIAFEEARKEECSLNSAIRFRAAMFRNEEELFEILENILREDS